MRTYRAFMRWACPVFVALLCLTHRAAAIVPTGSADDSQYIAYGNQSQFNAVGEVFSLDIIGTGTLISPDWVLTAGHVSHDLSGVIKFDLGGQLYDVLEVITCPGFSFTNIANGCDLGLIHLADPVDSATGIVPAILNDSLTPTVDLPIIHVGFGATYLSASDEGTKRAANAQVASTFSSNFFFTVPAAGDPLAGGVGPGDSGGPAFVTFDGHLTILGTQSTSESAAPIINGITAVGPARSFIDAHVPDAVWTSGSVVTPPTFGPLTMHVTIGSDSAFVEFPDPFTTPGHVATGNLPSLF